MNKEFYEITKDLMYNPTVLQMKKYKQHYDTDCYEHCLEVAYWSYLFTKNLIGIIYQLQEQQFCMIYFYMIGDILKKC